MRELASVQKVSNIRPIHNADRIEVCSVLGWEVIVKKGEFKEGDLCVFFEIDSMIPMEERYYFLGKTTKDKTAEGYRLRTMKMRGQLSQGLAMPFREFDDEINSTEGFDLTKRLGVWLYEPKLKQGSVRSHCNPVGLWPSFIPKTDQERIQRKMHYFDTYKDEKWEASLKLDGSSMTVWSYKGAPHVLTNKYNRPWKNKLNQFLQTTLNFFRQPKTYGVCSRNINLREEDGNAFWAMANKLELDRALYGLNVAIQGELIGPTIQSNHEGVEENEFYIFDVYDITKGEYMLPLERRIFCERHLPHVPHVPIHEWDFTLEGHSFDSLQEYVTGRSMNGGVREGLVFKSEDSRGLSFKCISNQYLLKEEV